MKSKRNKLAFVLALIMAFAIGLTGCGGGDDGGETAEETYTIKIGTGSGGKDNQNVFMEKFKERIEAESDKRITVELYPAGQLGNLAQLTQGVQDGSVEAVCIPTTYFATAVPEMSVLDMPYLWTNDQAARALMDNETSLNGLLEEKGTLPVAWIKNCERQLISTKDLTGINSVEELQDMGMKIWCNPSEILQAEVNALGGTPSNIDIGEVTPSLQNGTLDAALLSTAIAQPFGMAEVAPYWMKAPNDPMISLFILNKAFFDGLPEDLQQLILDISAEVNEEVYAYAGDYEKECLDKMVEVGLTVIEPSEELSEGIREACEKENEAYLEKYPELQSVYDELKALVE